MRILSLIILATACTSSPSDIVTPPPTTPDRVDTLNCGTRLADFCTTYGCNLTLEAALHDQNLCDGLSGWATCGDYQVISQAFTDTGTRYFYQDGQLVAIEGYGELPGRCSAGPEKFEAPFCASAHQIMPQCKPSAL